ncbi:MAG: T9SS type A sorting domain-containing protein [Bacteroidetes bacterium]|nr:T9SS type A sorting domain-containing protein [Bacteroidota bacterium]
MFDTTYSYQYDTTLNQIDSFPNSPFEVLFYNDTLNPTSATDTLVVWPTYYNNYTFDTNGVATDSLLVPFDSIAYQQVDSFYTVFEVKEPFEIARAITPYGMAVNLWYDLTDYQSILRDSVTLQSNVCGYSNGWFVTTDFYFIEGTPPLHASKVTNLWNGTFAYGNANNPIENHLQPLTLTPDSTTVREKIRLITTGHGFGGFPNQEVAEFYDVTHTIDINGSTFNQHLWRSDCGSNPLYPQGAPGYTSTWFYKRANWCPGSYVTPHDYDASSFLSLGSNLTVDYNMVPYTVTGGPSGFYAPEYYIQSQAIEYDNVAYINNASIERIISPTSDYDGRRRNPICEGMSPMITIKNNGADTLRTVTVSYYIDNGGAQTYVWNGALAMMDSTSIELPPIGFSAGAHSFTAYLDQPNNAADEYTFDDTLTTSFVTTNVYNTNFIRIFLKTDNSPNEASWTVKDESGNVLYQRTNFPGAGVTYMDTVYLANGCYSFTAYDSYGDGLCCYNGNGFFRLLKGSTGTIIATAGDYGDFMNVNLTIDYQVGIDEISESQELFIYPNPSHGEIRLNTSILSEEVNIDLIDMTGRVVYIANRIAIEDYTCTLSFPEVNSGIYFLRLHSKTGDLIRKIVIE